MGLVQKIERPSVAKFEVVPSGPMPGQPPVPADRVAAERPASPVTRPRPLTVERDRQLPDVALGLLSEVSSALPALMQRCRTLETELATSQEQAGVELRALKEVAREWQRVANVLKAQVEQLQQDATGLRARAEAAEQETATVKGSVDKMQHAAAEAECLTLLFQNKVIAAFGAGSESHAILQSVRSRTDQMLTA